MRTCIALACAVFAASCKQTLPPLAERTVTYRREYLADAPSAIQGDLQHVTDGIWCSDDGAFSLPVIPYPDGPVTIRDSYEGWGTTNIIDLFSVNESVLQVVRTRIRSDWTEQDAIRRVERSAREVVMREPAITAEWVYERGRKELQEVNPMTGYNGRGSAIHLSDFQDVMDRPPQEGCRVDRHLFGHGYYIQLIAVAYRVDPSHDRCKVAEEMAAWAAEHIQIGKGCGPAGGRPQGPVEPVHAHGPAR